MSEYVNDVNIFDSSLHVSVFFCLNSSTVLLLKSFMHYRGIERITVDEKKVWKLCYLNYLKGL